MPVMSEPYDCKCNTNSKSANGLFRKGISRLKKDACLNRPECQCITAAAHQSLLRALRMELVSPNPDVYNPEACI